MPACRRLYILITLGFLFCGLNISAQTSKLINEDFKDILFPAFAQKVENITGCRFLFQTGRTG